MCIETTIQSLYFHDNTSIYSICTTNTHVFTAGGDSKIRSWHVDIQDTNIEGTDFIVTTPINSSVRLSYCETLEGHHKTVNCIRNFEINSIYYLISCDDGGKIILWGLNECKYTSYKLYSTDPCTEIIYAKKEEQHYILCGTETGKLILFNLILSGNTPTVKLLQIIKAHSLSIDGLTYNKKYNIISSLSKDATCKLFKIQKNKLALFESIKKINEKYNFADENEVILVRRHKFSECGNFLYLTSCEDNNGFLLVILRYPFHEDCVYKTIEYFKAPIIKIIEDSNLGTIFFTNYDCYLLNSEKIIKDCALQPIIDGCVYKNILFIASVDGFLTTIRFN